MCLIWFRDICVLLWYHLDGLKWVVLQCEKGDVTREHQSGFGFIQIKIWRQLVGSVLLPGHHQTKKVGLSPIHAILRKQINEFLIIFYLFFVKKNK